MANAHAAIDIDSPAPSHTDLRAQADQAYDRGQYSDAVLLYEQAANFNGIDDAARVAMLIRKANVLQRLARLDDMHDALDEAWDIAQSQGLLGLLDDIDELRTQHAALGR